MYSQTGPRTRAVSATCGRSWAAPADWLVAWGEPAERRRVRQLRARFQVAAVLVGDAQPLCGQLDGDQGDGVVKRLVVIAGVALQAVRERVHPGCGRDRRREAEH